MDAHDVDIERWRSKYGERRTNRNKILIVDSEIRDYSLHISIAKEMGFHIERAYSNREALLSLFFEKSGAVFLSPVVNGDLRMYILESIKRCYPDIKVVLVLEDRYRDDVMKDWRMLYAARILRHPAPSALIRTIIRESILR